MNITTTFSRLRERLTGFFSRYHFLIFFVFIMSGLMASVLIVNATVISYPDDGYVSQINKSGFDEETIKRLRSLRSPEETTEKLDVTGRITPF